MITIEALKQEDMPQLIELYKELIPPHIEFNTSLERCLKTYKTMEQDDCSFLAVAKENGEIRFCIRNLLSVFGESIFGGRRCHCTQ